MRTLIVSAIAALLFAGCQKEETNVPGQSGSTSDVGTRTNYRQISCTGCDENGQNCDDCCCDDSGGNCLPDVIVTPSHQSAIDDVFDAVRSGVQQDIIASFSANKLVLLEYVSATDIDQVIYAQATARAEFGTDGARYLLIHDGDGRLTMAYEMYDE